MSGEATKWKSVSECNFMALIGVGMTVACGIGVYRFPGGWEGLAFAAMGGLYLGISFAYWGLGRFRRYWNDYFGRDIYRST